MAKKKSKKQLYIILTILGLLIVFGVVYSLMNNENAAINVSTAKVERKTIIQTVSAVGKIQPETLVKISSEASGEIVYLAVKEGDTVKAGSILVRIKPDIIETQLEQMKSAADAANMEIEVAKSERDRSQSDLKRITDLYNKEFSSKQELETSKSTYDKAVSNYQAALSHYQQAISALKQVQKSADRTTIYSPINGIITKLSVEKGEKVVGTAQFQGTELMQIADLNVMNALVDVDENDIVLAKIGDTAKIEVDALREIYFKGVVLEIGHSAKVSSLGTQDEVTNFTVKIRFVDKDTKLRPGMSCNVEVQTDKHENVLAIPLTAVTVRDMQQNSKPDVNENAGSIQKVDEEKGKEKVKRPPSVVFIKNGNKAKQVSVKTGISDRGFIEVTEGLKENDVIISGNFMAVSKLLRDGSMIQEDPANKKKTKITENK